MNIADKGDSGDKALSNLPYDPKTVSALIVFRFHLNCSLCPRQLDEDLWVKTGMKILHRR